MSTPGIELPTNQIVFAFIAIVIGMGLLVAFLFIIIISYYKVNARRQSDVLKAVIETQERERMRIAFDMHDGLGPLLSAVKLNVGGLRKYVSYDGESSILSSEQTIDHAIEEIRHIIRDLTPRNIDERGLISVLYDLKMQFEKLADIKINISLPQTIERFPLQFEISLYRIVQEILNNSIKHSHAQNIFLSLEDYHNKIEITVRDDGMGFERNAISEGSGLKNIDARVKLNQGRYLLETAPSRGTLYFITFEKEHLF